MPGTNGAHGTPPTSDDRSPGTNATDGAPAMRRRGHALAVLTVGAEIVGLLLQLLLVWIGAETIWGSDDPATDTVLRFTWCIVAFAYLGATALGLNLLVRSDRPDPRALRALVGHPLARALSTVISLGASLLGLSVALDLLIQVGRGAHDPFAEFSAVCALLLSWAMFNWGYARVYFSHYHRAAEPPLRFPGTDEPRLVDFVYLAFTNATTFAVSDVQVLTTRMRWTVVWHTSIAFFFNALLIALALNLIMNGSLFAEIFG